MGRKQLWTMIAGLVLINCLTVVFFLTKEGVFSERSEVVATVGNDEVLRQDLVNELEKRYGKSVLKELVDTKVIGKMAKKYDIQVSEAAIDRELTTVKTLYGSSGNSLSDEEWRQRIKYNLLLDKIITKDVVVSEEEMKDYFEQNSSYYSHPTFYHVSRIVVKTEGEAKQALKELEEGSAFSVLARERSIDAASANQGGDIGYVSEEDEHFSSESLEVIQQLKPGKWSKSIQTEDGYTILFLHDLIQGKQYTFKEVKDDIRRHFALNQIDGSPSAGSFWDEMEVELYEYE